MTPKQLRLVDGDNELVLWRDRPLRRDVIVTKLDVSSPDVRAEVNDRPDDDGTDDDTERHGAAAVSLEMSLYDAPQALFDAIKPYVRIGRRPYLCLTDDEWESERRIRLRADQWTAPLPWQGLGRWVDVQLQWKAPDGVWESSDAITISVPASTGQRTGLVFPAYAPWVFPASTPSGQMTYHNPGTSPSHQKVRLYGPCHGPRWTCDTTGESLVFKDTLVLGLGEYVEVDTSNRTAFAMSEPDASRLSHLDFAASTFWRVPPGESQLRYHPVSNVEVNCSAEATFRPAW